MIYISSSCVKAPTIRASIEILVQRGFHNIELSGGTNYYEGLKEDLLELKAKYNLNLLCHNYFPPPQTPFVLNLASLDEETNRKSVEHVKKVLDLSRLLDAKKFAVHAGFIIDIPLHQLGKPIDEITLFDREKAFDKFCENVQILMDYAGTIEFYIENNVLSYSNYQTYAPQNPFFFTDLEGYQELNQRLTVKPLLDVAHLKVSAQSLDRDFEKELFVLNQCTDYIHISDNDGLHDTNRHLEQGGKLYEQLAQVDLRDKTITLEVYNGLEKVEETYKNIKELITYNHERI